MRRWEWKGDMQSKKEDDMTSTAIRTKDLLQCLMILTKHVDHVPFPQQDIPQLGFINNFIIQVQILTFPLVSHLLCYGAGSSRSWGIMG